MLLLGLVIAETAAQACHLPLLTSLLGLAIAETTTQACHLPLLISLLGIAIAKTPVQPSCLPSLVYLLDLAIAETESQVSHLQVWIPLFFTYVWHFPLICKKFKDILVTSRTCPPLLGKPLSTAVETCNSMSAWKF